MMAMTAIGIYKLIKSRSLDGIKIEDLREMQIKLDSKINKLNEEINDIEEAIENLLNKAKETTTKSQEISLANRIKTLTQKKKLKESAVIQLEKELTGVNNLLILKENEKDLKEAGVWKKLKKIKPEKIEKWLTAKALNRDRREEIIKDIISLTSLSMGSVEYDEELEEILNVIHEIKKGESDAKSGSAKLMKE